MLDKLRINEIHSFFKDNDIITYKELYKFYLINEPNLNENSFKWRIYNLKKFDIIRSLKKGIYEFNNKNFVNLNKPVHNYVVLTADVINSKERQVKQKYLNSKIESLNSLGFNSLISKFHVSRGDEFQAICSISNELPRIIRYMKYYLLPEKIRIGVGVGNIEEEIFESSHSSWDMNGEAFFNARNAISLLNNYKKYGVIIQSSNTKFDSVFNLVYKLVDTIIEDWTEKQWEAIQLYDEEKSFDAGAKILNISTSSFFQRCQNAKWDVISDVEITIANMLVNQFS